MAILVNVFANSSSIVLSDEMASRLFGDGDPVGKQLLMNKTPYEVKGVCKKSEISFTV